MSGRCPLTLLPSSISYMPGGTFPKLEIHLAIGNDVFNDKKVVIIFYDTQNYNSFRTSTDAKEQAFFYDNSDFTKHDIVGDTAKKEVNEEALHPKVVYPMLKSVDGEPKKQNIPSGVLLTLEGVLKKNKSGWCFGPLKATPDYGDQTGDHRGIWVVVHTKKGDEGREQTKVAKIYYPETVVNWGDFNKQIAMRIIADEDVSTTYPRGTVFISSLRKQDCNNPNTITIQEAAFSAMEAVIGDDGGQADSSQLPTYKRAMNIDLTGFYHAIHPDNESFDTPLMVEICQAGHGLAGWFYQPGSSLPTDNAGPSIANLPVGYCGFYGDLQPGTTNTWSVMWGQLAERTSMSDPELKVYSDPFIDQPFLNSLGFVYLVSGGTNEFERVLQLELLFRPNDSGIVDKTPLKLKLVRDRLGARVPWELIDLFCAEHKQAQSAILAYEADRIPDSYWHYIKKNVTKDNPDLCTAIKDYNDGQNKSKAREALNKILQKILPSTSHKYYEAILARMHAYAQLSTVDGSTCLEWMVRIASDHLKETIQTWAIDNGKKPDDVDNDDFVKKNSNLLYSSFLDAKIYSSQQYVYTLTFRSRNVPSLPWIKCIGGGGFMVQIKKEKKNKDGGMDDLTKKDGFEKAIYYGAFLNIGFTIKPSDFGFSGSGPVDVSLPTFADLNSKDFEYARFHITSAQLFSGSFNGFVNGNLLDSALFQLTTKKVMFSQVIDNSFELKFKQPSVKETWDMVQKQGKDISLTIIDISQCHGMFLLDEGTRKKPVDKMKPELELKDIEVDKRSSTMFAFDQAQIQGRGLSNLESFLAIFRCLFVSDSSEGYIRGYTCPKGTAQHNKKLSQERAEVLRQAINGIFGNVIKTDLFKDSDVEGLGEDPAIGTDYFYNPTDAAGNPTPKKLLDAEDPNIANTGMPWLKQRLEEEKKLWPLWRFAEVFVNGHLVVRTPAI